MDSLSDAPIVLKFAWLGSHVVLVHVQFYGTDSLGDAPIVPACLGSHAVLVPVQHLASTAWAMHRLYLGPRAWVCTLYFYTYSFYGMDSLSDAPIVLRPACLDSHVVLIHVQFLWHGQPGRCTDRARVLGLARCTCTRTVFGMDSLSDARSIHGCLGLPVYWYIFVTSRACTYACAEVGLCAQGMWLFVPDVYRCNCTLACAHS